MQLIPSCGLAEVQVCAVEDAQAVAVPEEQDNSLDGALPIGSVCEDGFGLMIVTEIADDWM